MSEVVSRVAAGVRRRVNIAQHRGTAVWCPICDRRFSAFKDDWNRPNALCWRCGSHERHRAQWLFFEQRPELLSGTRRLLHFAPEHCLRQRLRAAADRHGLDYVTGDLDPAGVDLRLDLTDLQLDDASFDAVVCSHVLEHVEDDAAAMRELRRITAPGGWCLAMVPMDIGRATTLEDPSVTTPEQRLATYWQHDHVRLYGRDVAQRLERAGFAVETIRPHEAFGAQRARECALLASDWLFLCR